MYGMVIASNSIMNDHFVSVDCCFTINTNQQHFSPLI